MKYLLLCFFSSILTFTSVYTQSGILKGTILDSKTNDAMIGATIQFKGTDLGTTTDIDGYFEVQSPSGIYELIISSIGYSTIYLKNIRIESDKETIISTTLQEESLILDAVEVKAQRKTDTEISVVSEIKQLTNIVVGVSSQQISKTQDRDASQIVRRIPGVSIFDDRFIIIRGLNERYNTVMLNDIIPPSTEVDVKSFSFDLIPSSAIDRIMIYKSPASELPGDMAGGAIKIYTKTVPDKNQLSGGITIGYRNNVTGQSATDYIGSRWDIIGFGNSYRKLPLSFPSTKTVITTAGSESTIENFRNLNAYYNVNSITIQPDARANLNFSRRWFIGNRELTNISYVNYSNTNTNFNVNQNRFLFDGSVQNIFRDTNYSNNVRVGLMSNWSFILNPKSKLELHTLFNQIAIKETVLRTGQLIENDLEISNQSFRYEQRSILSAQLNGTHELSNKSKFKWISGFGYTRRTEPDFRRYTSSRELGSDNSFKIDLQQFESPTLQQAARFWSYMDEFVITGSMLYETILGNENSNREKNNTLRLGTYSEYKDRYFKARWFGIVNPNRIGSEITELKPELFFSNDNLRSSRVYYSEGTNYDDKYTAQNILNSAYANVNLHLNNRLHITSGIRLELNQQLLQSRERGGGQNVNVNNLIISPLVSANITYNLNTTNLIRLGYGTTVNRPEFRELAPFTYYDFIFDVSRRGNKDIKTATIHNFDFRYDIYPSKGELITIGVFYKKFINPIETAIFYNGSTVAFTVANSKSAQSAGVEMEIKKDIIKNLSLTLNTSLIHSNVVVSGLSEYNRYLQGQSPYIINTGLFYNIPSWVQINLLYNIIGPRIYVIGDNILSSNVFEMPRNTLDFNIIKIIGNWEFKSGIQDIFNQPFKLIQDTDRNNKITESDGVFQEFKRGQNMYVSITYKL